MENSRRKKGEGLIREYKPGKWNARIKLNGKSRDFYGDSEKEVARKLNDFKKKVSQGQTDNKRMSYSDFLDLWLDKKSKVLKEQSYIRLELTVEKHVRPHLGFYNIDKLDTAAIQDVIDNKTKGLSHSTVKKVYDAINASLRVAQSMGKIIHNPVDLVDIPTAANKRFNGNGSGSLEVFTDSELQRFIPACNAKHKNGKPIYKNAGLFVFMLNTGLRIGEALALKWSDYSEAHKTIRVNSTIIQAKDEDGRRKIKEQATVKTKGSERVLKLNSKAIEVLPSKREGKYIYCNAAGNPLSHRNVQRMLDNILTVAGIEHKSTHAFRHTFASRLFAKGIDIRVISELLGHSDTRVTYNTYISLINQQKAQAMEAIEDMY